MTISAALNRFSYAGNGVTTAFSFPAKFLANADLVVLLVNNSTGVSVTQTLTTHYTVTGAGADAGGTVTMVTAPATGYTLVIYGDPAVSQTTDFVDNDPLPAASIENALDKLTILARRLKDRLDRALRFTDYDTSGASGELPTPVANRLLGWNSGATALENKVPADLSLSTVTSYINTLLDDSTASDAQTTLGLSAFIKTLIDDATATAARATLLIPGRNAVINGGFSINQRAPATNADDTYAHDRWYTLNQSNPIAVSTLTDVEDGMPHMARLTQSNAVAQRMGYAQIIEGKNCKHLRGQQVTFRFSRVRISNSQAIRYAILEWTGTEDSVTSDVVNDWTSSDYTDGAAKFFVDTSFTPSGNTSHTPSAATLTDGASLTVTLGSTFNNLVVLAWTEGTAAQNVTLDLGKAQLEVGAVATDYDRLSADVVLAKCQRYYEKSFPQGTAPAQNAGTEGALFFRQIPAAATGTLIGVPYKVTKRTDPTVTTYNPSAANAQVRNTAVAADCTNTSTGTASNDSFLIISTDTAAGSAANNSNAVHWAADAEL